MSMRSIRVLTSAAGSAALVTGLFVLTPAPSADAATASGSGTYTCTTPVGQSFQLPADFSLTSLPDTLAAGVPVPAGTPFSLDLDGNTLTTALGTAVLGTNYTVNQLSMSIGTTPVTSTVTSPLLSQLGAGLLGIGGTLGTFTPQSSDLPVPVPTSFNLIGTVLGVPVLGGQITCTLNPAPGSRGSTSSTGFGGLSGGNGQVVTVSKQAAKLTARQLGHQARLRVQVKNQTGPASGKVVAKVNGRRVGRGTLHAGTVRISLKHLPRAMSRVRVLYRGDAVTTAAHKTVRVKTVRVRHAHR